MDDIYHIFSVELELKISARTQARDVNVSIVSDRRTDLSLFSCFCTCEALSLRYRSP